jgi:CRP/FNR family transcriptional regulator, cyclic AMP receptor protein
MAETLTLIEKTVFLKSVEVLSGIPTEALAQLAARVSELHADPGEVLFREGEEDRGTFVIVQGLVELRKDKTVVRMLEPGVAYGEFFLERNEPHQYTGIARQYTHALNIQREDVVEALLDYPEFGLAMVKQQALRTHQLTERVIELEAQLKRFAAALKSAGIEPPEQLEDRRRTGVAG